MTSCNNVVGFDGEILDDSEHVRTSKPAHLSITMWILNIFEEKDKPESLIHSIDLASVDIKFPTYPAAL